MANLRDIRRRIKSVKNTAQITRAMQLVAAAKMKKAQDQALAGREYADELSKVLGNIAGGDSELTHPLLRRREGSRELVLVISTDKGLCGPLNTNLSRHYRGIVAKDSKYITVGRKLRIFTEKIGGRIIADFTVKDPVAFSEARAIAKFLTLQFSEGNFDKVSIAFTRFFNTLRQEPDAITLLPVQPPAADPTAAGGAEARDVKFEPSPAEVLDAILPLYINYQVYQALLEARASEHSARMVAMKAATDNAKKFIKELTLEYNKVRQAAITSELLEITTAMKAME